MITLEYDNIKLNYISLRLGCIDPFSSARLMNKLYSSSAKVRSMSVVPCRLPSMILFSLPEMC